MDDFTFLNNRHLEDRFYVVLYLTLVPYATKQIEYLGGQE